MKTVILAAILAVFSTCAHASNCAPRDMVISRLTEKYGESQQIIGLTSDQRLLEVFGSAETGTWTILITGPRAESCVVSVGREFQNIQDALPPEGDPA